MIISCKCRFIYKIVWMMIFTTFKKIFVIFSHIVFFRSFNSIINFLFFSSFYFSSLLQPHLDIYLSFLSHYLLLYSFPFIQFYSIFLSFIFFYYLFFSFFFFFTFSWHPSGRSSTSSSYSKNDVRWCCINIW